MYTLDLWVSIPQVGHPPSEPTFVFATCMVRCCQEFIQFGVVLRLSSNFSTFLATTLVSILQVGLPNHPPSEPTFVFAICMVLFTGCCQEFIQFGVVLRLSSNFSTFLATTRVSILQVGLPNHPPSEPTFFFAIWFFLLVVVREFIEFGVVLDCPAISAHFWPQLVYTLDILMGSTGRPS